MIRASVFMFAATLSTLLVASAHAQAIALKLKNGDKLTGTLVEYLPDERVSIQLGGGTKVPIPFADVLPESLPNLAVARQSDGKTTSGTLVEYIAGDHLILLSNTKRVRLEKSALSAVTFERGRVETAAASRSDTPPIKAPEKTRALAKSEPSSAPEQHRARAPAGAESTPAEAPASDAVRAVAVQALLTERQDWSNRFSGVALPTLLTTVGAVALIAGSIAFFAGGGDELLPGVPMIIGGSALTVGGIGAWFARTSEARKATELQRIDRQLQQYGVQASGSSWSNTHTTDIASRPKGVQLSVSF